MGIMVRKNLACLAWVNQLLIKDKVKVIHTLLEYELE